MKSSKTWSALLVLVFFSIVCFVYFGHELSIHSGGTLDLSEAEVDDIKADTIVNAKITDTVGAFMYEEHSKTYYYLIPMENGKYIVFATNNKEQKSALDTYIDSYDGTLDLEVQGRISKLDSDESRVFYNSISSAGLGVTYAQAKQIIVPYKITNDDSVFYWIVLGIGCVLAIGAIIVVIVAISKDKKAKALAAEAAQYYNPENTYADPNNAYNGVDTSGYAPYQQINNGNMPQNGADNQYYNPADYNAQQNNPYNQDINNNQNNNQ